MFVPQVPSAPPQLNTALLTTPADNPSTSSYSHPSASLGQPYSSSPSGSAPLAPFLQPSPPLPSPSQASFITPPTPSAVRPSPFGVPVVPQLASTKQTPLSSLSASPSKPHPEPSAPFQPSVSASLFSVPQNPPSNPPQPQLTSPPQAQSQSFSIPQPQTFSVPQPQSPSPPQAQSFNLPQPQTFSVPQPQTTSPPQAQSQSFSIPQPQTFSVPQPQTTSPPQAQSQSFSIPQPQTFSVPQPQTTSPPQAQSQSFSIPQPQTFSVPQPQTTSPPQAQSQSFSIPQPQTFSVPQPQTTSPPQAQSQSFSIPQPQTFSVPQPQSPSPPQAQSFNLPQPQTFSVPQPQTTSPPQAQSQSFSIPQPQTFSVPQPQSPSPPQAQSFNLPQPQTFGVPSSGRSSTVQFTGPTAPVPQQVSHHPTPLSSQIFGVPSLPIPTPLGPPSQAPHSIPSQQPSFNNSLGAQAPQAPILSPSRLSSFSGSPTYYPSTMNQSTLSPMKMDEAKPVVQFQTLKDDEEPNKEAKKEEEEMLHGYQPYINPHKFMWTKVVSTRVGPAGHVDVPVVLDPLKEVTLEWSEAEAPIPFGPEYIVFGGAKYDGTAPAKLEIDRRRKEKKVFTDDEDDLKRLQFMADQLRVAKEYLKIDSSRPVADTQRERGEDKSSVAVDTGELPSEVTKSNLWSVAYAGNPTTLYNYLEKNKENIRSLIDSVGYVLYNRRQWGIKLSGEEYVLGLGKKGTALQFAALAKKIDNVLILLKYGATDTASPKLKDLLAESTYKQVNSFIKPRQKKKKPFDFDLKEELPVLTAEDYQAPVPLAAPTETSEKKKSDDGSSSTSSSSSSSSSSSTVAGVAKSVPVVAPVPVGAASLPVPVAVPVPVPQPIAK